MKKTLSLIITFALLVSAAAPQAVAAKTVNGDSLVELSWNQTYTEYDITGDGQADTITISSTKKDYWYQGLEISVNGEKALSDSKTCCYDFEASICTLSNGKVYLYLYNSFEDGDADYCGLYQYQNGKFKCALDMNKFYGSTKLGYHTSGAVKAVSGNKITVSISQINYEVSGIEVIFDYKYSGGKLVQVGNTTSRFTIWSANKGKLTASKNMSVYKKTNCKSQAFTLKTGQKIKVTGIYCKSGMMLLKVKRISDGKTGYIKCIKSYPKSGIAPFKEAVYAG